MRKVNRKKVMSGVMALCMCLVMAGCGDSSDKSSENTTEKTTVQSSTSAENQNNDSAVSSETESEAIESQADAEPITFEPSEEILNADFDSGKIQIGDDVFQTGGYFTLDEFIKKYGDKYELMRFSRAGGQHISTMNYDFMINGEYGAVATFCRKDILEKQNVTENEDGSKEVAEPTEDYFTILAVLNSPVIKEEIKAKDAIVTDIRLDNGSAKKKYAKPFVFYPKDCTNPESEYFKEFQEKHLFADLPEYLESLGLKEHQIGNNTYEKGGFYIYSEPKEWLEPAESCSVRYFGEKNMCNRYPMYMFDYIYDPDTHKLSEIKTKTRFDNININ